MADQTTPSLGQQLRYFRKKLMYSQAEMARHLGISASLYTKLETNLVTTTARRIEKIALCLHTSVDFLTSGQGPEYVESSPLNDRGADELRTLSLDSIQRLVELAQDAKLISLAEQVAPTMHATPQRAMAVVIRTMLLGENN